jgi:hypothetical protein
VRGATALNREVIEANPGHGSGLRGHHQRKDPGQEQPACAEHHQCRPVIEVPMSRAASNRGSGQSPKRIVSAAKTSAITATSG